MLDWYTTMLDWFMPDDRGTGSTNTIALVFAQAILVAGVLAGCAMTMIAALEVLDSPPSVAPTLHHDRRYVDGVFLAGWKLGRAEIEDTILGDPGVVGLVLNPASTLHRTSPVLVGGMDGGEVRWVAPLSPDRVVLGNTREFPGTKDMLRAAFAGFWDDVLFGLEVVIDDPPSQKIWDPGTRFGDHGIELGEVGTPVHPTVPLLDLDGGLGLWVAMSTGQRRARRFLGTYSEEDVIDTSSGTPLVGKKALIEGKGGQVELAHFAVLSGANWTQVGAHLAAGAISQIVDSFANVWARDSRGDGVWGRDLWACDPSVPPMQRCEGCRLSGN